MARRSKFLKRINRFLILVVIGYFLLLGIAATLVFLLFPQIESDVPAFGVSYTASLLQDLTFFGLVGLVLVIAQFSASRGDTLYLRLQRLFGNKNVDHDLLEYFVTQVRQNGVYSEKSSHTITITGYEADINSYVAVFQNVYVLHNAFGDVNYKADVSLEIVPDYPHNDQPIVAELISIISSSTDGVINHLETPEAIPPAGISKTINLNCKPDEIVKYITTWWSFIDNQENSGFSVKRFSKDFKVTIVNESETTARLKVGDGSITTIERGERTLIFDSHNVSERVRVDFSWLPPLEFLDAAQKPSEAVDFEMLQYDKKHGDKTPPSL